MKKTKLAAIDVGTTKVSTIIADTGGVGGLRVLGVGIAPSQGIHKGLVANINEAKESIQESVRRAEQVANCKLDSAYVSVTGQHVGSMNSRGAIAITRQDQLVRREDLKRVLAVAHSTQIPSERRLLHVIPRTYKVDDQEGIDDPVGMHGFRLDVETHIVTTAITSIQNLAKCIQSIGVNVGGLVLGSLASAEAVLSADEKQDGVMLADIGGGTTDIAIFKNGTIYHTAALPVAGYQVTRDISIGLDLSPELSEEMKKKYGNVMPTDEPSGQAESERTLTQNGHIISYNDLLEIIRVRVGELLRLMVLELPQTDYSRLIPSGLVLTGGSANLPGISQLAEKVTRLPVRVGTPVILDGVSDMLRDPAYATSVGLLLWNLRHKGGQGLPAEKTGSRHFLFLAKFFSSFARE